MEQVTKFRTVDGEEFEDKNEAKVHELKLSIGSQVYDLIRPGANTRDPQSMVNSMFVEVERVEKLRDLLNKFLRSLPKPPKA